MRIVIPIHSFEPGGVERTGLNLAAEWQRAGEDVVVVLGRDAGATRPTAPQLNYVTRPEPIATHWWETPWMIWCLFLWLRSNRADVLFCAGNTYGIVCVMMKLLLGRRCPPVIAKMSNDLERREMPALGRRFYHLWLRIQGRHFDLVVGMAEPMRDEIAEFMAVPQNRITVIHDPSLTGPQFARLSRMERPARRSDGMHVVSIGRLWSQKNYGVLLQAFAQVRRPADRLTIVGEGPERPRLERLVAELGIADAVDLPGHVHDTAPLLEQGDIFALSSDYEGVPAVIIEALAAAMPIVTTDCSRSMASLVGHGKHGLLVRVGDVAQFADKLDAAREFVVCAPSTRAVAEQFVLDRAASTYLAAMHELSDRDDASAHKVRPDLPARKSSRA
ncbi:glycosyltransferase [Altererythrobacter xixiisoli]|uniref:Glycosyltransferase n=1 Tax=Croceibacterium xixiisoli TaxID=1476466 RepID=A0A6I4TPF4_9SPHN|nr:glycosyltransferase [Croceibacterium xixiisoli]MXO97814.1 glycosyltransferase [Croceibacterium xixiisoli]